MRNRLLTIGGLIILAGLSRLLPHPGNMTPVAAMAIFGGFYFQDKRAAFIIPIFSLFLSDMLIGFHSLMIVVYACFLFSVWLGYQLRKRNNLAILYAGSLLNSIIFFIVTNLGVWLVDHMYPMTPHGLWTCYAAALPFFRNQMLGDLLYLTLLVGSFGMLQALVPSLKGKAESAHSTAS